MANPIRNKLHQHASIGRKQIEAQAADLNALYIAARERLESRIYNYVREKRSSFTGPKLVLLMEELRKEYADFELKYTDKLKYALNYVVDGYYRDAMLAMGLTGNKTISGGINKERIKLMMDDAFSHVAGATRNMEDYTISSLRRISAQVMREASLTGESRAAVARRLLTTNNRDGLFRFIDRAGRKWDNEAYFNMLSRTLLHNNAREAYLEGCADEGNDIVTVSSSGDPCKVCARWENRLLSISGRNSKLPSLQSAIDEGLFHPNCTHRIVAVPPEIAAEYYTPDGREKQQETQTETPESAAKKDGSGQKSETHEQHLARRQAQREAAYDNRRDKWHQSILDAGGSKEIARELADLYTPQMSKLGKPPKIIFGGNISNLSGNGKVLTVGNGEWNSCSGAIRHEFEHWVHKNYLRKEPHFAAEIAEASQKDWAAIKKMYKGRLGVLKGNDLLDQFSRSIFGSDYSALEVNQRYSVVGMCDTIGSISNGNYGFGHEDYSGNEGRYLKTRYGTKNYYKIQNMAGLAYGEAIANISSARAFVDNEKLKLAFPNIYVIVQKLEKTK